MQHPQFEDAFQAGNSRKRKALSLVHRIIRSGFPRIYPADFSVELKKVVKTRSRSFPVPVPVLGKRIRPMFAKSKKQKMTDGRS